MIEGIEGERERERKKERGREREGEVLWWEREENVGKVKDNESE